MSERRRYEGFVICDERVQWRGKFMTYKAPFFDMKIIEDFVPTRQEPKNLQQLWEQETYKSIRLHWVRGIVFPHPTIEAFDQRIDFWVPSDKDFKWGFDRLLNSYTEKARREEKA